MDNTNLRNMKNNVHLRDIAEIVGVNTSTVSLVLNGNARKCRISKALEDRIIDIARQLDYKPNALARSLRLGKTNIIGMIVPDISNPTFANLSRHIEKHAKDYGYRLMVCSSGEDDDNPYNLMESLVHHQLDGLIVVPTTRMKPEDMKKTIAEFKAMNIAGVNYVTSSENFLEIIPAAGGKGAALKKIAAYYGIPTEDTIAAGDHRNDIDMIRTAGMGCSVANACEEVKAAARYVAASNNDGAVSEIIKKFTEE